MAACTQTPNDDLSLGKGATDMMGRITGGVAVAAAIAVLMGVPSIAGIETWKWALALAGLVVSVWGGLSGRRDSR